MFLQDSLLVYSLCKLVDTNAERRACKTPTACASHGRKVALLPVKTMQHLPQLSGRRAMRRSLRWQACVHRMA